jgi:hypothetical protein
MMFGCRYDDFSSSGLEDPSDMMPLFDVVRASDTELLVGIVLSPDMMTPSKMVLLVDMTSPSDKMPPPDMLRYVLHACADNRLQMIPSLDSMPPLDLMPCLGQHASRRILTEMMLLL